MLLGELAVRVLVEPAEQLELVELVDVRQSPVLERPEVGGQNQQQDEVLLLHEESVACENVNVETDVDATWSGVYEHERFSAHCVCGET